MVRESDEWRYNPDRRAIAERAHAEWLDAIEKAEPLLQQAEHILSSSGVSGEEDPLAKMIDLVRKKVWEALYHAKPITREPANETRVGNMAAFDVPKQKWRYSDA